MTTFHYFRVHFVCQPGGSRKTEYYVLGTIEEVKEAVEGDLASGMGAYHALFYGEDILVQCWQNGEKIKEIDLHPFISYRIEGIDGEMTFPGVGDRPILDMDDPKMFEFMEKMVEEQIGISVVVDWSSIEIPAMDGTPLPKGTEAPFENKEKWQYGLHPEWDVYI